MSDEAAVSAAVELPPPDNTPAVTTPEATIPSADKILEAIKAKVKEGTVPPLEPKKDGEPDAAKTKDTDPKLLRQLGTLQGDKRALEAKVKALEPLQADATLAREVRELWNKGGEERVAALAKLSGKDGLDTLAELVAFYYEKDQEAADAGGTPTAKPTASPEMKALLTVVEDLKKEIVSLKEGKTKDAEGAAKTEAEAVQKAAGDFVKRFLTTNAEKFEISARADNQAEAVDLIQQAAMAIVERDKIDIKTLTQESADELYMEAATEVEAEYEKTGQRFAKTKKDTGWTFDPDKYRRHTVPPPVRVKSATLSGNLREREAQVRAKLLEKFGGG